MNNRVSPSPLETRGAIGQYDPMNGYTLHLSCQGAHWIKDTLCKYVLTDVPSEKVRVITPDVGGGFGTKLFLTPEYVMVLWAAKRVGRPVKWISDRTEGFLSDTHGRDNLTKAELALNAEGKFLGLRVSTLANMGAYLSEYAPTIPTGGPDARRGPTTSVQRMCKCAASSPIRASGIVPRRRPPRGDLYDRTPGGSGWARNRTGADGDTAAQFRPPRRPCPIRRGSGMFSTAAISCAISKTRKRTSIGMDFRHGERHPSLADACAGSASPITSAFCGGEPGVQAELQFEADGTVTMTMGTQTSGQGHATAYSQIVAERLGIPFEAVNVRQGDTAWMRDGSVTAGSRSIPLGGVAAQKGRRRGDYRGQIGGGRDA